MKKWLAIATAIGSLTACGGSPTAATPPANIAGEYNMSVTASPTCAANLPSDARNLEYAATITQSGAAIQVKLVAKLPGNPSMTFPGTVSGQTVSFPSFTVNDTMGRGAALTVSGNANVAANGLTISGALSGTYQTPSGSTCNAANHQLQFVKLCPQPFPGGIAMVPCGS